MGQIRTGHFEADGNDVNLILGFVPSYLRLFNANATTGEVAVLEWFGAEMGDAKEFRTTIIADNGSTANTNFSYASSGGDLADYDTNAITTTDPDSIEDNYIQVTGGKGVTIDGSFMEDSDEVFYLAIEADRDVDHGDINA